MGQEYELKFAADQEQQEQIYAAFGPWHSIEMETTYYDTPSRSLSQRHITLRRRMENGISVCTVKTPMGGSARGEWECQWDDIHTAIEKLCAIGAPAAIAELARKDWWPSAAPVSPAVPAKSPATALPANWPWIKAFSWVAIKSSLCGK